MLLRRSFATYTFVHKTVLIFDFRRMKGSSPYVLKYYGMMRDKDKHRYGLVMEYVNFGTLADLFFHKKDVNYSFVRITRLLTTLCAMTYFLFRISHYE